MVYFIQVIESISIHRFVPIFRKHVKLRPHFLLITSRKTSFFYKKIYSEEGLCIIHKGPITINYHAKIGKYFRIHPMTTIGKSIGNDNSSPTIGNDVWIGPVARIIGNIKIENNVVVGTNSVVNKNFPSNVTIAGIPAKKRIYRLFKIKTSD